MTSLKRFMQIREEEFKIKTYDCGANGKIKISTLMQYLQEIAANHAEALGFGFGALNQLNVYWALSNIRIEFETLPEWNGRVIIRTWPSGYSRLLATREFVGNNEESKDIFKASSEWMILDKETSKPRNLKRLNLPLPKEAEKALTGKMKRLQPRSGYDFAGRLRVPYSAIDLNGHVNNTEYVKWAMDEVRRVCFTAFDVAAIQSTYLSEVFEGDEVDVFLSRDSDDRVNAAIRKSNQDTDVFLMGVVFKSNFR